MADRLEPAASGRARCRACGRAIEKGALRFGEELPNPRGEGDAMSVFWFHLRCAAHRRPEKVVALLRGAEPVTPPPEREPLLAEADLGVAHPKLARIAGAEKASSGRARCRHCQELIALGEWRMKLSEFADTGFFEAQGFVHARCLQSYLGVSDPPVLASVRERLAEASPDLDAAALDAILNGP